MTDLVANDALIPPARRLISQPERRLYLALLYDALRCLNIKAQYNDAYRWLTDLSPYNDATPDFIPLAKCCEILGISARGVADAVRQGIRVDPKTLGANGYMTKVTEGYARRSKNWVRGLA